MMKKGQYIFIILVVFIFKGKAQEVASNYVPGNLYQKAKVLAYDGDYKEANSLLMDEAPALAEDFKSIFLLARTYSWMGQYGKARAAFNKVILNDRTNTDAWISAIKNELYANTNATALGLANKALIYLEHNENIQRLKLLAEKRLLDEKYPEKGWFNVSNNLSNEITKKGVSKVKGEKVVEVKKTKVEKEEEKNRISVRNSFSVFDQRYDPMIASSIAYKRQTKYGAVIPKINYANRLGQQGVQYDLDMYPKLAKKIYAYVNYGYSNASIFPSHKMSGDVYFSLPKAFEVSVGGRHMIFENRNVTVFGNSIGHYRGNYYFSLRSYITPKTGGLARMSGNLVARKYLKDGENFLGINVGMGYSPELRQFFSDGNLLAETMLYIESQRIGMEYQFSVKNSPNVYRTNIGVTRQELSFDAGSFFWGFTAGLTYNVQF